MQVPNYQYEFNPAEKKAAYENIPLSVRTISITTGNHHLAEVQVFKTPGITLYNLTDGAHNEADRKGKFFSRDELLEKWSNMQKEPDFSYTVSDKNTNLYALMNAAFAHYEDPRAFQDTEQIDKVYKENFYLDNYLWKLESTCVPEQILEPASRKEIETSLKDFTQEAKTFLEGNEKSLPQFCETLRFIHQVRLGEDFQEELQPYLHHIWKQHPEKDASVAGAILPGAKNTQQLKSFIWQFQEFTRRLHMLSLELELRKNQGKTSEQDAQKEFHFVTAIRNGMNQFGVLYNIPLVRNMIKTCNEAVKEYIQKNPDYRAYQIDIRNHIEDHPYRLVSNLRERDLLKNLPTVTFTMDNKKHSTLQGNLLTLYHDALHQDDYLRQNAKVSSITKVSSIALSNWKRPRGTSSQLYLAVQEAVAMATQTGAVFLEEVPRERDYSADQPSDITVYDYFSSKADYILALTKGEAEKKADICFLGIDGDSKVWKGNYPITALQTAGIAILPSIQKEHKIYPKEYQEAFASCQKDFVKEVTEKGLKNCERDTFDYWGERQYGKQDNLHTYLEAVEKYNKKHSIQKASLKDFETTIDPALAKDLTIKVRKDYPDATSFQVTNYVGKIMQAGSPLSFKYGKEYGINIAENTQKNMTQAKKKEFQQ